MSLLPELLLTVLFGTQASFTHPGVILPQKELLGDTELKNIVKKSQRSREARETLGYNPRVWRALTETLKSGNDQLIANKHHLLPKVWDLAILGRNLLAAKEKAQDLSAEEGFEAEIRRLLDICIEKAGKPIASDLEKPAHDKEMQIKSGYKKVLITALQFLNNLMTQNETRKLHVWLHMFGTPSSATPTASSTTTKSTTSKKAKGSSKPLPSSGSGVGLVGSTTGNSGGSHNETVAKCNSLSAGFNAKYYKPGFMTEIPRLLQPDEIEPLPMILQSGVVAFEGTDQAMQAVRCKLMLAQGYGRNLLREVLIFLGAWEVDEDDFCYRMMSQVIEAILINGLVPYAYECFRDEKDIVTPAQSVLLKLLVSVYRPSAPIVGTSSSDSQPSPLDPFSFHPLSAPSAVGGSTEQHEVAPPIENSIPAFFVGVFRKQVLPPTIKIIKLQGAIRKGQEKKESFEYSLWDLDRIYEGVYQFLELLVLFSEDEEAKKVLLAGDKGLVADLVEFLGELDSAIPRWVASKAPPPTASPIPATVKEIVEDSTTKVSKSYMVERPFDVHPENEGDGEEDEERLPIDLDDDEDDDGRDDERGLAEPEDFTWPHIKRYLVLLLSGFAWKNKAVQNLVREKEGLQPILNQCMIDDDNPYIREHAILCIKNMLEGNPQNQKIVEELDAVQTVPSEVLDKNGYEHFIDESGRVQLRKLPERKM
ncbi:uncharacterized protein LAJ45_01533 [Morchella importuna]|uniref:Ataxin-10 homolog n=1 Tax=Morchella conica CCBAS932 TaxID=1392247 RepID=A0A3N4KGW4_9PEZI|nr:uncharacterized protein LAJ45_01533 [Morchella importuna]KAH8153766.1 hypothetical protein LAJ45_01533 [Morchella importuna]RPB09730.1 hypothetical protein P167DRAFT_510312 [Morchella conica CCBAS932]